MLCFPFPNILKLLAIVDLRPYWLSRMQASYCTLGIGVIIRHDMRTLLPRDSPRDNLCACVRDLSPRREGTSRLTKSLATKKTRYNNSPPYVTAR